MKPDLAVPARIVLLQACTAILLTAGFWAAGTEQGFAALLGGAVSVGPNAYFAWRSRAERDPVRLIVQGVAKLASTVSLMAVAFAIAKPAPLGFFAVFIATQAVHVVGALGTPGSTPGRRAS